MFYLLFSPIIEVITRMESERLDQPPPHERRSKPGGIILALWSCEPIKVKMELLFINAGRVYAGELIQPFLLL